MFSSKPDPAKIRLPRAAAAPRMPELQFIGAQAQPLTLLCLGESNRRIRPGHDEMYKIFATCTLNAL
jgi:hypothetical protein